VLAHVHTNFFAVPVKDKSAAKDALAVQVFAMVMHQLVVVVHDLVNHHVKLRLTLTLKMMDVYTYTAMDVSAARSVHLIVVTATNTKIYTTLKLSLLTHMTLAMNLTSLILIQKIMQNQMRQLVREALRCLAQTSKNCDITYLNSEY